MVHDPSERKKRAGCHHPGWVRGYSPMAEIPKTAHRLPVSRREARQMRRRRDRLLKRKARMLEALDPAGFLSRG